MNVSVIYNWLRFFFVNLVDEIIKKKYFYGYWTPFLRVILKYNFLKKV